MLLAFLKIRYSLSLVSGNLSIIFCLDFAILIQIGKKVFKLIIFSLLLCVVDIIKFEDRRLDKTKPLCVIYPQNAFDYENIFADCNYFNTPINLNEIHPHKKYTQDGVVVIDNSFYNQILVNFIHVFSILHSLGNKSH